jgi:glycosyltransferase involved in cell wall biosynthesis
MNICIYTENHLKGGVDTFLINLINAWPDSNDVLTLSCNASHPGLETILLKVRNIVRVEKYYRFYASKFAARQDKRGIGKLFLVKAYFVLTYRMLQYPILFPWYVFSLALKFRKSDFDRLLVVNGGYPASLLCRSAIVAWRLSGKKSLATMNFHNSAPLAPNRYRVFEDLIDKMVAKSTSHIITVSRNCLNTLSNRPAFDYYKDFHVIHNGIEEPSSIDTNHDSKLPKKLKSDLYLLMLATYEPRKGHKFLLESFQIVSKLFPNLKLCIYGYSIGNQKEIVANEVLRLGLEDVVELNDFTSDTNNLVRNATILVVPSQEYESFNLTIIEAMACGTPIVATDVGGMPEVLGDSEAGSICPKGDPAAFAYAILEILNSETLAIRMGVNGRKTYIDKYSANGMSQKYRNLLIQP